MTKFTPLDNVRILEFPGVTESSRGTLTVLENIHFDRMLPSGAMEAATFPLKRVFYIHNVPEEARRGGHAHLSNIEILICLCGSLDIVLTDGTSERKFHLSNPSHGLIIPPEVWNNMSNYAPGTILLVLCSEIYEPSGYINDYNEFKHYMQTTYNL